MTTATLTAPVSTINNASEFEARIADCWFVEGYAGILYYTEEGYAEINGVLRSGETHYVVTVIDSELNTLSPKYSTYYRGLSLRAFKLGMYEENGKVYYSDKAYTKKQVARNFLCKNYVLLVIEGESYSIAELSSFPEEKEFLWGRGSHFEVIGHEYGIPEGVYEGSHITPMEVDIYYLRQV